MSFKLKWRLCYVSGLFFYSLWKFSCLILFKNLLFFADAYLKGIFCIVQYPFWKKFSIFLVFSRKKDFLKLIIKFRNPSVPSQLEIVLFTPLILCNLCWSYSHAVHEKFPHLQCSNNDDNNIAYINMTKYFLTS
jgi:hypothetical protein